MFPTSLGGLISGKGVGEKADLNLGVFFLKYWLIGG